MWLLYNIFALIFVLLAAPVFLFKLAREKGFDRRWLQSLGFLPRVVLEVVAKRDCIWIHAASVGEIVAASPIVREIRRQMPNRPILISVVTTSGYAMANRIMVEADAVIHFPIDLPLTTARVIDKIRPAAFIMIETELWPNFIRHLSKRNVPIIMMNGRISDRSVKYYGYLGKVLRDILQAITLFCMQSEQDARYIRILGADPERVIVTGNTKFDQTYSDITDEDREQLYKTLHIDRSHPVIVAGSTHPGEEDIVIDAFRQVRRQFPAVRLILAPRQILRAGELELQLKDKWRVARRTALANYSGENPDVVLLDTIGELGAVYSLGDIIFVGGSLIPQGGHNVLEPAAHAKPILVGPHMFNFKASYALLTEREACLTVSDVNTLAAAILELLSDQQKRRQMGESALAVIIENRGASARSAIRIKEILQGVSAADN